VFVDGDETDDALKNDVLDGLLPGRGVSRIRYVPKISQVPPKVDPEAKDDEPAAPEEELDGEYVCVEHVDYRDYREGYGRVWGEVPWVGFRHKLTHADALEKFAEDDIASIKFTAPEQDDPKKPGDQVGETQKIAEFWEIWDKIGNRVFFIQDTLEALLFPKDNADGAPPFDVPGFYPNPKPLAIIENTGSRLPIPMFTLYQEQANELDKISGRIDKIVNGMRLRGVYDAKLSELADLVAKDDNELTPVKNAQAWLDGGLDKAISWMPVEKAAAILASLYDARDRQKVIIDEILGISDIIRGATDPNETATAQNLKSNYGSVRLQRMQKEVQRYARDLLRIAAAVMGQKFSPETFAQMTDLNFPTAEQKQMLQMQLQQQQMQAMAPQAQPPATPPGMPPGAPQGAPGPAPIDPAMLKMPTWEDVIGVMRSEKQQQYRIDVETDSTIAGTMSSDMAGLSQVLQAISTTLTGLAPLVQDGALPVDAAKEIVMSVIRRARMGMAVEDAFDKMTAPKPPPDPNAGKAQAAAQVAQISAQSDEKIAQLHAESKEQIAQMHEEGRRQMHDSKNALDAQKTQFTEQMATQRQQMTDQHQTERDFMMGKLDAMVKIVTASMAATKASDEAAVSKADAEIGRDIN
jgi:hypothetical protein